MSTSVITPSQWFGTGFVGTAYRSTTYRMSCRSSEVTLPNGLYTESMFRNMLVLERKRTERTKQPFMLFSIEVKKLTGDEHGASAIDAVAARLERTIREHDMVGWLYEGRVIGVVVTSIDSEEAAVVSARISAAVDSALTITQREMVKVSEVVFPFDENTYPALRCRLNSLLYDHFSCSNVCGVIPNICKRGIDIVGSVFGILLFLPLFLVIPVIIKLTTGGKAFFVQERIGRFGKSFRCIKFRTMEESNDCSQHQQFVKDFIKGDMPAYGDGSEPVYKIQNDPRVTPVGRWLRKTSLDELPQFFNVLLGHMSIVGPRPAIEYEVEEYDLWHRRRVLEMKPGITGIWQIAGRSRCDFNSMVRMDIKYINTWSPFLDLRLIVTTPLALVSTKGAC